MLNTGSYCPCHYGHINLLNEGINFLLKNTDYEAICEFISPTHNSYVYNKACNNGFKHDFLNFE